MTDVPTPPHFPRRTTQAAPSPSALLSPPAAPPERDEATAEKDIDVPATPQGIVYRAVAFFFRALLGLIIFALWVMLTIVWFALVLRVMGIFAIKTVANLFRDAPPPDPRPVDAMATLWLRGVVRVVQMVFRPQEVKPIVELSHPLQAIQETLLAILLYAWLIFSYQVAHAYIADFLSSFWEVIIFFFNYALGRK